MAYPKEKDAIFAKQEKQERSDGFNFMRINKFNVPVFTKKAEIFVEVEYGKLIPEKMWRHFFKKKI